MNRRILGATTAATLIAGSLLVMTPSAASAQTVTEGACSGDSLVSQTLASGSGWQMCWRIDSYRGLVLDQVAFQPRDDAAPFTVLDSIALAQLNVPYDTGATEYNDVTSYKVGAENLQSLTDVDCPAGQLRSAWVDAERGSIPALCIAEEDSGLAYRANTWDDGLYVAQGTDLVLHSTSRIGWYEYVTEYRFHDDGEISVRLGATGDLSPFDYVNVVNQGWPIGEGDTDYAVNHYHSAFWKVDFGIDGGGEQKVEKFTTTPTGEYGTTGDTGRTAILDTQLTQIDAEEKTLGANREAYRVVNPGSLNADGHARSYEIIVPRDQAYNLNPETDYDIAFTNAKPDEVYASHNLVPSEAGKQVTDYVDGETLTDPVAWVNVGFHHINRDEDQSPMPIHWQGFTLYPRDFAAQNPNVPEGRKWVNGSVWGQPNPNETPTPTPSPTATPTGSPTATPTTEPTATPTGTPTAEPTSTPTSEPTSDPTSAPSAPISFSPESVAPGGTIAGTASGFIAGESVTATMHSAPVNVGTFLADDSGTVRATFSVPSGTTTGEHRLVLTGQRSGAVAEGSFTVKNDATAAIVGALASTGTDANRWAWVGILLLAAGTALAGLSVYMRRSTRTAAA